MYMDDKTPTPYGSIGEELLRKMLDTPERRSLPDLPPREAEGAPCLPRSEWGLTSYPLGMVYAPLQSFRDLYDRESALQHGTLFRELDLPFLGESVATTKQGGGCCD